MSEEEQHKFFMLDIEWRKLIDEEDKLGDELIEKKITEELLETVTKKKKSIKAKKAELEKKMNSLKGTSEKYEDLSPLKRKWRNANYSEKRSVASSLIKKIIVQADGSYEIIWKI